MAEQTTDQSNNTASLQSSQNSTNLSPDTTKEHNIKRKELCESKLAIALKSQRIKTMISALWVAGCPIDPLKFFKCKNCVEHYGSKVSTEGTFDSRNGLVMCEDADILSQRRFENTMVHELIHVYDLCRANINPTNCVHIACTEIRASTLSGECSFKAELMRGKPGLRAHGEECVKRRALLSLNSHPHCAGNRAESALSEAWSRCSIDWEPFHYIP